MIGRSSEIAVLQQAIAGARSGRSTFVSLTGDPGIGKTTLIDALVESLDDDITKATARCHPDTGQIAYRPWHQILRTLLDRPASKDLYEVIGIRMASADSSHIDEPGTESLLLGERVQLYDATVQALADISCRSPLVLVFEDVHWADSPTLLLLQFVAREIASLGIVVVVTHRPEQIYADGTFGRAVGAWENEPLHRRIDLRGLPPDDARELVRQEAAKFATSEVASRLLDGSHGNPLQIIQSVRSLFESGSSRDNKGTATAAQKLPSDVNEVILSRIEALPPESREVLEVGACIGSEFEYSILRASLQELGLGATETTDAIDITASAGLVEERTGIATFGFSHALIRESLLSQIEQRRKRKIHGAIVLAIESLNAHNIEANLHELAFHSYESAMAGGAERAARYARDFAGRAYRELASEEAALWYERALEAARLHDPTDLLPQGQLKLGVSASLALAGRYQESIQSYAATLEIARNLDNPELFGWAAIGLSTQWGAVDVVPSGGESRVEALILEALQRAPKDNHRLRAALLARAAVERAPANPEEAESMAAEALGLATEVQDPRVRLSVLPGVRISRWRPDNIEERRTLSETALATARDLGEQLITASIAPLYIIDLLESGHFDAAKRETSDFRTLAHRILTPFLDWQLGIIESMWMLSSGAFDEAEAAANTNFNRAFEHNAIDAATMQGAFAYALSWFRGDLAPHEAGIRAVMSVHSVVPGWRAGLALICVETGQTELAYEEIRQLEPDAFSIVPRDASFLVSMTLVAECAARLEDKKLAEKVYPLLEPFSEQMVVVGPAVACHGAVASYLGALASLLDRPEAAAQHFDRALVFETAMHARALAARTRIAWAEHLWRCGEQGETFANLLYQAHRDATELGMTGVAARCATLRHRMSADSNDTASEPATADQSAKRAQALFQCKGDYRTITYAAQEIRIKETKGLAYTEHLLRHPGRDFFAVELAALLHGADSDYAGATPRSGDAGETLDSQAVASYRKRAEEARDELAEAEENNDLGRITKLRDEIEFLADQLSAGLGLGGRKRKASSDNERARVNVTRAIRASIRKIADAHPQLGRNLINSIRTGNVCSYEPDPDRPTEWQF